MKGQAIDEEKYLEIINFISKCFCLQDINSSQNSRKQFLMLKDQQESSCCMVGTFLLGVTEYITKQRRGVSFVCSLRMDTVHQGGRNKCLLVTLCLLYTLCCIRKADNREAKWIQAIKPPGLTPVIHPGRGPPLLKITQSSLQLSQLATKYPLT